VTDEAISEALVLDVPYAFTPMPGVCCAGQPSRKQLEAARERGVKTVVNVCAPYEGSFDERKVVEHLGMGYVNIPISGAVDLTQVNAARLGEVLNDRSRYPVLVHCASSNRVGALFALKAFYEDHLGVEQALELGRSAGLRGLEPAVREKLESA